MKFLTKYPVAILLSIVMIALSVALGQSKHLELQEGITSSSENPSDTYALDLSLDTSPYDRYIIDGSNVLSSKTKTDISLYNANWYRRYQTIVSVVTINTFGDTDLTTLVAQYAENFNLNDNDALLLWANDEQKAYFIAGDDFLADWTANDRQDFLSRTLLSPAYAGDSDGAISVFLSGLHTEFVAASHPTSTSSSQFPFHINYFTLSALFPFIVFLFIILTVADNIRYSRYAMRYGGMMAPPILFRPLLFWHGPTSRWYLKRQNRWHQPPPPPPPGGFGGYSDFGGSNFRGSGFGGKH